MSIRTIAIAATAVVALSALAVKSYKNIKAIKTSSTSKKEESDMTTLPTAAALRNTYSSDRFVHNITLALNAESGIEAWLAITSFIKNRTNTNSHIGESMCVMQLTKVEVIKDFLDANKGNTIEMTELSVSNSSYGIIEIKYFDADSKVVSKAAMSFKA